MNPCFAPNDLNLFYKYLNNPNINVYFEYGSGGSTYQASLIDNIKKIYCVESDLTWLNLLKKNIKKDNVTYIFNEMDTQPNTWGHPGKNSTENQKINYSSHMQTLNQIEKDSIDLVLIDGRFRVACCLKCFDIIKNDCYIVFDDFLDRPKYHIILKYFDIVEKTSDERMVILKKKENISVPQELIKIYELIQD